MESPEHDRDHRLSRRHLLAGAALAGGAYLAPGILSRAAAASAPCCTPVGMVEHTAGGNTYRYAAGQLLVDLADDKRVQPYIEATYPKARRVVLDEIGTVKYTRLPSDLTKILAALRARFKGVRVSPNHYYRGAPVWQGGPGEPPGRSGALTLPTSGPGAGVTIGIADTGYVPHPALAPFRIDHTTIIATRDRTTGNRDPLDMCPRDGMLDCQAGHGTFINSVVVRSAPESDLVVANVLDSAGFGLEDVISLGVVRLAEAGCQLINLSLCGETDGNLEPIALGNALRSLPADTVICCAAGNHGGTGCCEPGAIPKGRRIFPAAFAQSPSPLTARVVSVGALASETPALPATFSNSAGVTAWALGRMQGCYPGGRFNDGRRLGRWVTWGGTSFAAPRVAAAIAQRMSSYGETAPVAWDALLAAATAAGGRAVIVPL